MYRYLSIISFKRHQVCWWSSTLHSSAGLHQMAHPMRSIASTVISEPGDISVLGQGLALVFCLPVDIPHDWVSQLEGGHL